MTLTFDLESYFRISG